LSDELPGSDRAGVRTTVSSITAQMTDLAQRDSVEGCRLVATDLAAAWAQLVKLLALGPAPEYRECPHCKKLGMRAATRCGFCWAMLIPPVAALA